MKILIFGDLYGRIGRKGLAKELPILKHKYNPDFVVVNGENMTSGRGPIESHIVEIKKLGVDVITGGDHIFDNQKNIIPCIEAKDSILIRPANFYESKFYRIPGKGYKIVEKNGQKLLVIHLIAEIFMNFSVYNPFLKVDELLNQLGEDNFDGIIIDFHKETSSEGYGMVNFLDGRVSAVYGTHTHVQTNDEMIFPGGTAFISDVGMNGPLNSVIGADYNSVQKRFLTGISKGKIEQSLDSNYLISGLFLDIGKNRKANIVEKIRIRGKL